MRVGGGLRQRKYWETKAGLCEGLKQWRIARGDVGLVSGLLVLCLSTADVREFVF